MKIRLTSEAYISGNTERIKHKKDALEISIPEEFNGIQNLRLDKMQTQREPIRNEYRRGHAHCLFNTSHGGRYEFVEERWWRTNSIYLQHQAKSW